MQRTRGIPSHAVRDARPCLLLATVLLAALAATSHAAPPTAQSATATAFTNFPLNQPLQATDDGLPNPPAALTFIITTLPAHGTLADPNAGPITTVPYTLAAPAAGSPTPAPLATPARTVSPS